MELTNFSILLGEDEFYGAVAIRCDDGKEPVLALVDRKALDDYLTSISDPRPPALATRRTVVEKHLEKFQRLIRDRYERGEYEPFNRLGSTIPCIKIDRFPGR
jgi:hypothetical protein